MPSFDRILASQLFPQGTASRERQFRSQIGWDLIGESRRRRTNWFSLSLTFINCNKLNRYYMSQTLIMTCRNWTFLILLLQNLFDWKNWIFITLMTFSPTEYSHNAENTLKYQKKISRVAEQKRIRDSRQTIPNRFITNFDNDLERDQNTLLRLPLPEAGKPKGMQSRRERARCSKRNKTRISSVLAPIYDRSGECRLLPLYKPFPLSLT